MARQGPRSKVSCRRHWEVQRVSCAVKPHPLWALTVYSVHRAQLFVYSQAPGPFIAAILGLQCRELVTAKPVTGEQKGGGKMF